MKSIVLALAASLFFCGAASAHPYHHRQYRYYEGYNRPHFGYHFGFGYGPRAGYYGGGNASRARARGLPWCGAFMADLFHIGGALGRSLWVAANWAHEGRPTYPHVGAVVVWPHHVGKIVGGGPGHWVVLSGNDGHRVRERARSVSGAIAFRDV